LISLIVAMAKNRVIGNCDQLPWHLPTDLHRFKQLTMGHSLLMGRRTFESIGQPLPGRQTIILSRNPEYRATGCKVATDINAGIQLAGSTTELFICGGGNIYRQTLPLTERLYVTEIDAEIAGDSFFPNWQYQDFSRIHTETCQDTIDYNFSIWQRSSNG